jgi:hypothetical protein
MPCQRCIVPSCAAAVGGRWLTLTAAQRARLRSAHHEARTQLESLLSMERAKEALQPKYR